MASILDVAAVLDPPLKIYNKFFILSEKKQLTNFQKQLFQNPFPPLCILLI